MKANVSNFQSVLSMTQNTTQTFWDRFMYWVKLFYTLSFYAMQPQYDYSS